MKRRTNRPLAAASFLILMLAVVPGMAYTGAWSGPEGDLQVIVAEEPAGVHHGQADGHSHSDFQQCRVGPSRCTSQPSFVSTTWVGGDNWLMAPPALASEIHLAGFDPAVQSPVYRMKPPPRET